jgi:phosphatidylinositol alpha-1,6-mannosyltransferase
VSAKSALQGSSPLPFREIPRAAERRPTAPAACSSTSHARRATLFLLTHEFFPRRGGIATFTEELAAAAARLGQPVEVWAPAAVGETVIAADERRGHVVRRLAGLRGSHGPRCLFALARHFVGQRRRLRPATVCLCEPGPMLALMPLLGFRAFRPRRLLLVFHGSEILRFHAQPVLRLLTRRLIRRADRVGVLTAYTENLLVDRFPEATPKLVRTPGALRADFAPAPRRAGAAAHTDRRLVVLTVGRLHPRKGQLHTLAALRALPPALRARVEYRLVGSAARPAHEAALRAAAADADFPVRFLGALDDAALAAAYAAADVFALTSVEHGPSVEGFGLVYLEAAAHGLPIIGHAIGGVPEAVADGVNGLLVPPGDPAALTSAFGRLLGDADLRARLGAAGPARARRHTWEDSARALFAESVAPAAATAAA